MIIVDIESNVGEVVNSFELLTENIPGASLDFAEDALNIMTNLPRRFIPAAHRLAPQQRKRETATGRLWSGWGRRINEQTDNPMSSPADNLAEIITTNGKTTVRAGTNTPYAHYVDEGRPFGQGRPIYNFSGEAQGEIEDQIEKAEEVYADKLIGEERTRAKLSLHAGRFRRSRGGQFAEKVL